MFLKGLYEENRSWTRAIAYYHSRTPEHYLKYAKKVMGLWADARREVIEQRRLASQADLRARIEQRAALRRIEQAGDRPGPHLRRVGAD